MISRIIITGGDFWIRSLVACLIDKLTNCTVTVETYQSAQASAPAYYERAEVEFPVYEGSEKKAEMYALNVPDLRSIASRISDIARYVHLPQEA